MLAFDWKGLPILIQCPPSRSFVPLFLGQNWAFCVKYRKCRGKSLSYLIQLSSKKEFDDKKENHPKGGFPKF